MSERKRSRAVEKWPRANSLWARSKALSAGASARDLPAARFACAFAGVFFAAARDRVGAEAVFFGAGAAFAGAALRTGAFSATRLGLGFADLAVSLRLLAEDFDEALCGAGREEVLFAPLMTGSLMRSTRFSRITSPLGKPPTSSSLTHERA